ncbi:MAG: hypothetical protein VCE91_18645 [Nitrospinota bacterium]
MVYLFLGFAGLLISFAVNEDTIVGSYAWKDITRNVKGLSMALMTVGVIRILLSPDSDDGTGDGRRRRKSRWGASSRLLFLRMAKKEKSKNVHGMACRLPGNRIFDQFSHEDGYQDKIEIDWLLCHVRIGRSLYDAPKIKKGGKRNERCH